MASIDIVRWVFNDYDDTEIILLKWSEYSFHINESSLRSVGQAEQKLRTVLSGGQIENQTWRDLTLYGLTTNENLISELGHAFIDFCDNTNDEFTREFWLYRQLYSSSINSLRNAQIGRIKNIYRLLYSIPNSLVSVIFDDSNRSNRIIAFAEHLISFPLALTRFFSLSPDDLTELVIFNDKQFGIMKSNFLPSEHNLEGVMKRINTYNRNHNRRRVAIISAMLIPIVETINARGSSPVRLYAPFTRFFSRDQVENFLVQLNYNIHEY